VKEEMESKQGEILALKDKLQESKTIVGHYWTFKIVVEKSLRNNTWTGIEIVQDWDGRV
jgi:hypothetical protein